MSSFLLFLFPFFLALLVFVLKLFYPRRVNRLLSGTSGERAAETREGSLESAGLSPDQLLSVLPTGLFVFNREFQTIYCNERFKELVEREGEELEGESLENIFALYEGLRQYVKYDQETDNPETRTVQVSYINSVGNKQNYHLVVTPLAAESGNFYLGVVPSFKGLLAGQTQVRQTERIQALGEMISGLAHEINNPLTGALGFVNLLLEDEEADPVDEELQIIKQNTMRCKEIIDNMLSFIRPDEAEKSETEVNTVIEGASELIKRELNIANIELEKDLEPELPSISINETQLQEIIVNLLTNAMEAIKDSYAEDRRIRVSTYPIGSDKLGITIEDSGPGIEADKEDLIFDPFYSERAENGGTGLGLSIVQGIVSDHAGEIHYNESDLGGARFDITFPISTSFSRTETWEEGEPEFPEHIDNVVLVDDEPCIQNVFSNIFEKLGLKYKLFASPVNAMQFLFDSDRDFEPDLILLDLVFPGHLEGQDFYVWLMENHPDLCDRVVIITGNLHDRKIQEFLRENEAPVLEKPISVEELEEICQRNFTR